MSRARRKRLRRYWWHLFNNGLDPVDVAQFKMCVHTVAAMDVDALRDESFDDYRRRLSDVRYLQRRGSPA